MAIEEIRTEDRGTIIPRFSPGRTALLIAGTFVASLIVAVAFVLVALASRVVTTDQFFADPLPLAVAAQGVSYLPAIFVLIRWTPWAAGMTWGQIGLRRPTAGDLGTGIVGGIGTWILATGCALLIFKIGGLDAGNGQDLVGAHATTTQIAILAVIATACAPVVEEIAFRGILLQAISARWGVPAGVAISSILFGAMHLAPAAFLPLTIGGIGFALCFLRTRNLWTPMTAHAVFNGIGMIELALARH